MSTLTITRLNDYRPLAFTVKHHDMKFDLQTDAVIVTHNQEFVRSQPKKDERGFDIEQEKNVVLNGEDLQLLDIAIDGKMLPAGKYRYKNDLLTLFDVPDKFTLTTTVRLDPDNNLQLSGLYRSNGIYCTQCEAEGFRRISFGYDRPDALATYRVSIEADKTANPVLLSNGNLEASGDLNEGRHYATWFDPHPKPSYLFALVAGDLAVNAKRFTTTKGKEVELRIYTEAAFIDQTDYALQSLIDAFNWDETRFNLSYDLDRFNLVAISDFNMGAMENKSLNIFNTKFVLANTETATDSDFRAIQRVIGHEYFHNWTGNRITCRDWFQLTLKEGLTVFRDQEFSSDLNERTIKRIEDVELLRREQFAEDGGPMSHPVQPQEYAAIDNFYTRTVYEKGAELIRMYHTIIGEEKFQKGMALYIERHDGQAVCIQDFAQCMEDASDYPFTKQFFDWYTTSGTPKVKFTASYNKTEGSFTLSAHQNISAVNPKRPLVIPIRFSLISPNGRLYRFEDGSESQLLLLDKERGSWTFTHADADLIPVLMQGFSAPIYYEYDYGDDELIALAQFAPDGFARYEAVQTLLHRMFQLSLKDSRALKDLSEKVSNLMAFLLKNKKISDSEKALLLAVPPLSSFLPTLPAPINMDNVLSAYDRVVRTIALKMRRNWSDFLKAGKPETQAKYSVKDAGIRALYGLAMKIMSTFDDESNRKLFLELYKNADCMTDRMNALEALNAHADRYREEALQDFYQRFADQPLVIDKWFMLQSKDNIAGALERIEALTRLPAFQIRNPNRFRALVFTFMQSNPKLFHRADGSGYHFVIEQIRRIIRDNPQLSARMIRGLEIVTKLDAKRKALAHKELSSLLEMEDISVDAREIIERVSAGLTS